MSVGWVDEDKLSCTSCNVPRDLPTEVKILNFFFSPRTIELQRHYSHLLTAPTIRYVLAMRCAICPIYAHNLCTRMAFRAAATSCTPPHICGTTYHSIHSTTHQHKHTTFAACVHLLRRKICMFCMTYSFSTMRAYTRMRHADGFGSSQRIDFGVQCDWPPMTSKWGVDRFDDKHRSCVCVQLFAIICD